MKSPPEKLHMYLGDIGGTGKSQIIKAIMSFFDWCNKSHRFLVVASTGSAAALVNGAKYYSAPNVTDGEFVSAKTLARVKARLAGVDYIFLDEISMISCHDMYTISAQCAKALGVLDEAFRGLNFILLEILLNYCLLLELHFMEGLILAPRLENKRQL